MPITPATISGTEDVDYLSNDKEQSGFIYYVEDSFYYGNNVSVLLDADKDYVTLFGNHNIIDLEAGDDSLTLEGNETSVYGGTGNDYVGITHSCFSEIHFGEGNDVTSVDGGEKHTMYGGTGNDRLSINADVSLVKGDSGNDTISSVGSDNQFFGGEGNDTLVIYGNNNSISCGKGDDFIEILGYQNLNNLNNNLIDGDSGNDAMFIGCTGSTVKAGEGDDYVFVDDINNVVFGGKGDDRIFMGIGFPKITQQLPEKYEGSCEVSGGTGQDEFHFKAFDADWIAMPDFSVAYYERKVEYPDIIAHYTVKDFESGVDTFSFDTFSINFTDLEITDTAEGSLLHYAKPDGHYDLNILFEGYHGLNANDFVSLN